MVEGNPPRSGGGSPELWSLCIFRDDTSQPGLLGFHFCSDWVFSQHMLFKYTQSWFLLHQWNTSLNILLYLNLLLVKSQADAFMHIKLKSLLMVTLMIIPILLLIPSEKHWISSLRSLKVLRLCFFFAQWRKPSTKWKDNLLNGRKNLQIVCPKRG